MSPSSTSPRKAAAQPVAAADAEQSEQAPLWEVVEMPGKGRGIVVTRDVSPGTLLLSEAPLLSTAVVSSLDTAEQDLGQALSRLSGRDQERFRALHNNFPEREDTLCAILQSNGYPMGADAGGVFPDIARLNHSCRPNAVQHWNARLGRLLIHAVRPIARGAEVTTAYQVADAAAAERQRLLRARFRFDCRCELCALPPAARQASDERIVRGEELRAIIGDARIVDREPERAVACARRLFHLYEQDGIRDGRYSALYYDLFQICNMHSDLARARCFAKYYADAATMAEGDESVNVLEIKPFIKNPQKHESYFSTKKWETKTTDVPRGLKPSAFARWLWRETV